MESSRACNRNDDGKPLIIRTQFRETRCSYFLNLNLQGLKADDIELEMDKERRLLIRGRTYSKDMGTVNWRWRVFMAQNGWRRRRRRAFKIPEGVNFGAIRGSLEQGVLHVVMPKFRRISTSISPYLLRIFHPLPHSPLQKTLRRSTRRTRTHRLTFKSQTALIPPIFV